MHDAVDILQSDCAVLVASCCATSERGYAVRTSMHSGGEQQASVKGSALVSGSQG